jgi:heat shock protein HslJ
MRSVLGLTTALLLAACATTPPNVGGGEWRAADVNGLPVTGARALTLTLGPDGRASGNAGCNSFSGTYAFRSRDRIDLGPLAVTRMACEPPVMEQEARYLSILEAAETYSRYGDGSLSIIAPDGRAIRFRRGG